MQTGSTLLTKSTQIALAGLRRYPVVILLLIWGICVAGIVNFTTATARDDVEFSRWVEKTWPTARSQGVSRKTFDLAFFGVVPNPDILTAANHQPEFVRPIWDYLEQALSDKRIQEGRHLLKSYGTTLEKLEQKFGVDRHILVAIWGLESSYGNNTGKLNVIRSLATLGYQGSRREFGVKQLVGALQILERGDVPAHELLGSWAGAMGQTQFIPTTYNAYAIDVDGDGRRNIWTSAPDALGSTANYLAISKWKRGEPTVIEIKIPENFNFEMLGLRHKRKLADWVKLGVQDVGGGALRASSRVGAVILPAGASGPAFMVFRNFRSILRYNNAHAYALAVSYLAKRFQGKGIIKARWPVENRPLSLSQKKELQQHLLELGHKIGKIDGKVGKNTRQAIKAYQRRQGFLADGYADSNLLLRLQKG